jgi:hypothetical protein
VDVTASALGLSRPARIGMLHRIAMIVWIATVDRAGTVRWIAIADCSTSMLVGVIVIGLTVI